MQSTSDPLEAALVVAARAGDAVTVARIVELMAARQRQEAGNVLELDLERVRRR